MEVLGIFVVLMVLQSIMSRNFFINICKFTRREWFYINVCAPSCFIFGIGYVIYMLTGSTIVMFAITGNLLYFGGGGLMIFPWKGFGNMIAQINHIWMVAATVNLYYDNFAVGNKDQIIFGSISALVLHTIWGTLHSEYMRKHPELMEMMLKMDELDFKVVQEVGIREAIRRNGEGESKKNE